MNELWQCNYDYSLLILFRLLFGELGFSEGATSPQNKKRQKPSIRSENPRCRGASLIIIHNVTRVY